MQLVRLGGCKVMGSYINKPLSNSSPFQYQHSTCSSGGSGFRRLLDDSRAVQVLVDDLQYAVSDKHLES